MKDVIYIDIEDDITAIIGKVKAAGTKIVALVPPKRIGVLQSVVNLKLLQRAAGSVDKHVVLITSDLSLTSLAAGLKMPVAKNLQSRPEIPNVPNAPAANEEIINGEELAVGDVAKSLSGDQPINRTAADDISDQVDLINAPKSSAAAGTIAPAAAKPGLKLNSSSNAAGKSKIPNFDIFRKRLFLIIGGGALLVILLVWAFIFAPHATITINAKTTAVNVDRTLTLKPSLQQSDVSSLNLKPNVQQLKKSVAAEFDATGTKDIGNKATGQITISNGSSSDAVTLESGTVFSAASKTFVSNGATTIPGAKVVGGSIQPGKATVSVTASNFGPDYNLAAQNYTVQNHSDLGATGTEMSGGTKETVTIISQNDVDKAKDQLAQQDANSAKAELKKQFNSDALIIEESFLIETGKPTASPAVGEQAKRAKVTVETIYTLVGLSRDEVKTILTTVVGDALKDKTDQQAYSLGENTIVFQNFEKRDGGNFSARLVSTGYIGPKINTEALAEKLVGKRYGEIQATVNEIPGVNNVDIKFSPFWVTTAPSKDKIDVRFTVANEAK